MDKREKLDWVFGQHEKTNHYYDQYLPYSFHLRMVIQAFQDWKHLLDEKDHETMELAAAGHDLIEDTRTSYNDVKSVLGEKAADIIYACSNEKGKTRKERANDKYYQGIREQEGAVFIKLCDRIANVQYSKMTRSRMFEMYKSENENFFKKIGYEEQHPLVKMFQYLESLFETNS